MHSYISPGLKDRHIDWPADVTGFQPFAYWAMPFSWAFSPGSHVLAPLALQKCLQPWMPEQYLFRRRPHCGSLLKLSGDFGRRARQSHLMRPAQMVFVSRAVCGACPPVSSAKAGGQSPCGYAATHAASTCMPIRTAQANPTSAHCRFPSGFSAIPLVRRVRPSAPTGDGTRDPAFRKRRHRRQSPLSWDSTGFSARYRWQHYRDARPMPTGEPSRTA